MTDFNDLLVNNSPGAQDLALKLRELIFALLPKAQEKIYTGWGVADFYLSEPRGRGFMSIGPQKNYVNLYFMNGVDLPDPKKLLTGTGKKLRHIKIASEKDLGNAALKTLIKSAAECAASG